MSNDIISIYFSHDSNVCISPQPGKYLIYELERLTRTRYYHGAKDPDYKAVLTQLKQIIKNDTGITTFRKCLYGQTPEPVREAITELWGCTVFEEAPHHPSHIAGAAWLSPFQKSLVISFDAGGWDLGTNNNFVIQVFDKANPANCQLPTANWKLPLDVCSAYTLLAAPIAEIKKTSLDESYLSLAGKVMGLGAYGELREEWIMAIVEFYWGNIDLNQLALLGKRLEIDLSGINTIANEKTGRDLAASSQQAFNMVVYAAMAPFIYKQQLPVVLTGGGALNVVFNQHLRNFIPKWPVFVPPNPNDCGLAFGQILSRYPPSGYDQLSITYNGFDILDRPELEQYIQKYNAQKIGLDHLAQLLNQNKIIGVMNGRSEVGPRALGNRSILCSPRMGMKLKLNEKIKHREGFRPFAPVVREEQASECFEMTDTSPYMAFNYNIRDKVKYKIPSVRHADGTARVQTVNRDQNAFLYDLLGEYNALNGTGVLLNTSLNIKGKPMITTIADAIEILNTTPIDGIYIEGWYFTK